MYDKRKIHISIIALVVFIGIIITLCIIIFSNRAGKVSVTITTSPSDTTVLLDSNEIISKNAYITPGKHVFTAKKDGFADASTTLDISDSRNTVALTLSPISDKAKQWVRDNAEGRNAVGDQAAAERSATLSSLNPLIDKLPYIDIAGPFAIDYGYDEKDNTKIYYLIHDTTPSGRINALKWIRDQGFDPTTLDIRFSDYVSPLTAKGAAQ